MSDSAGPPPDPPPVSRLLKVNGLGPEGEDFHVEFDAAERERVAEAFGVISVDEVVADGHVWPADSGAFVDFRLKGRVTQACVVTLEPVGCDVDERVSLHYTPSTAASADPIVIDISDEEDPPEYMVDGKIDVGAAMTEHLALGLDPYPRRPDAELPEGVGDDAPEGRQRPFEVLAKLKNDKNDNGSGN